MRKNILIAWLAFQGALVSAQGLDPVAWEFTCKKVDDKTYEVYLTADMEYPWHIYSQYMDDGGPVPTTIVFEECPDIKLKGGPREEGAMIERYEAVFMMDTRYYIGTVDFVQRVEVQKQGPVTLRGAVTFMACTDEQCLMPQEVKFNVTLN